MELLNSPLNTTSNSTWGTGTNYFSTFPSQTYTYTYICSECSKGSIKLKKVENGWILYKDSKEYVITDKKEILKYIE